MLMLSAAMLGSSTFAWFTMSKEVQVTGMEVKTTVGSNLLISTTNLDADYTSQTLSQTRKALLEPTSTINGTTGSYYYTVNAKANGDAVVDEYVLYAENADPAVQNATAGKANYDVNFNNAYKLGTNGAFTASNIAMTDSANGAGYGYIDYTFYLKATSNGTANATAQQLRLTKCDLDYNDGSLDDSGTVGKVGGPDLAWRVAIFAQDITSTAAGTGRVNTDVAADAANQKGLLSIAGATNQTGGKAVDSTTSATGDVVNNGSSGVVLASISDNNASKYYKVTVRLWLEGEDTTCTSETYAALTEKYNLDLAFQLTDGENDDAAVTNITSQGATWDPTTSPNGKVFTGNQYDGEANS
jgi:hypothetical protein